MVTMQQFKAVRPGAAIAFLKISTIYINSRINNSFNASIKILSIINKNTSVKR
jgi:hypothetical protein